MTYVAPSYEKLVERTRDLQQSFNAMIKRFSILEYNALCAGVAELENKYIAQKTPPNATRLKQIQCINLLLLSKPSDESPHTEKDQFSIILLGALIYRYLRLKKNYSGAYQWSGAAFFFGDAEDNSKLTDLIMKLLNIRNINVLDPQTIVTCCEAYRDYLNQNEDVQASYIPDQKDVFFSKLGEIISLYTKKCSPVIINQMQYVLFTQSILTQVVKYKGIMEGLLEEFERCLEKNKQQLELTVHRNHFISLLKKTVEPSLSVEFLKKHVFPEWMNYDSAKKLKSRLEAYCKCVILGSYILAINCQADCRSPLCKVLRFSISDCQKNRLDNTTTYLALTSLKQFLEVFNPPIVVKAWGTAETFNRELTHYLIQAAVAEKEPPSKEEGMLMVQTEEKSLSYLR